MKVIPEEISVLADMLDERPPSVEALFIVTSILRGEDAMWVVERRPWRTKAEDRRVILADLLSEHPPSARAVEDTAALLRGGDVNWLVKRRPVSGRGKTPYSRIIDNHARDFAIFLWVGSAHAALISGDRHHEVVELYGQERGGFSRGTVTLEDLLELAKERFSVSVGTARNAWQRYGGFDGDRRYFRNLKWVRQRTHDRRGQ